MKKITLGIASQKNSRVRVPAIARDKRKRAGELREDSVLTKLVKARRHERRIRITLNEL